MEYNYKQIAFLLLLKENKYCCSSTYEDLNKSFCKNRCPFKDYHKKRILETEMPKLGCFKKVIEPMLEKIINSVSPEIIFEAKLVLQNKTITNITYIENYI